MKKYMYLSMCLLVNMFTVELSAITNENSSDGLTHGHTPKCEACPPKDNCCTRLQCRTLIACAPIPVTCAPGATQITISAPGTYCLQNDTDCNILIKSSQVTFDLNGHTVNGIIYTENDTEKNIALQDLVIKNGIIMVPKNKTGIMVLGIDDNNHVDNLLLEDLAIYGNCTNPLIGDTRGLFVQFATHVVISRVYINGAKTANFQIDNSENVIIESSNFLESCGVGGLVGSLGKVSNLVVTDCNFYKNFSDGLVLTSVVSGNLTNCNFEDNNNNGLYIDADCKGLSMCTCSARNQVYGFYVNGAQRINFTNCIATNNSDSGFIMDTELTDPLISNAYFNNCTSQGTLDDSGIPVSVAGFNILGSTSKVELKNCLAQTNKHGFLIQEKSIDIMLIQCEASSNNNGFRLADTAQAVMISCVANLTKNAGNGFFIGIDTIATLNHCQAIGGGGLGNGFFDEAGFDSSSSYVSCYARANAINYNPALAAPFNPFSATTAGTGYWYNVFAL